MKFNLNTKPLKDAMSLAIINSNISKFFEKSTVVQFTVNGNELRMNTQATNLLSEAVIKGNSDSVSNESVSAIVDCTLFKQLVSTIDNSEMSLEFTHNALIVEAGRSKFNVPKLLTDDDEISLQRPASVEEVQDKFCGELHPSVWKYIQDHQLYAVALSQLHKAYTRVWMNSERGVLTGDIENSFFTYQPQSDLTNDCLVSTTVVNLLASLDENTKLYEVGNGYLAEMVVDSFTFYSQFTVEFEDPEGIGEYDADMLFEMIFDENEENVAVSKTKMSSNLKQAGLFSSASDSTITMKAGSDGIRLVNDNVNCRLSKDAVATEYECSFVVSDLDSVVNHMDGNDLLVSPIIKDEEVFGVRFTAGQMIALLGGVEA